MWRASGEKKLVDGLSFSCAVLSLLCHIKHHNVQNSHIFFRTTPGHLRQPTQNTAQQRRYLRNRLHSFHLWQCDGYLLLFNTWELSNHVPRDPRSRPWAPPAIDFPRSVEKPFFDFGQLEDPNHHPNGHQARAEAREADPSRATGVHAFVEAHGLGVHEEQVSFSEWLDFKSGGVADGQGGDACGQDQKTQDQGHLEAFGRFLRGKCSTVALTEISYLPHHWAPTQGRSPALGEALILRVPRPHGGRTLLIEVVQIGANAKVKTAGTGLKRCISGM